jgi:hypothetical protein
VAAATDAWFDHPMADPPGSSREPGESEDERPDRTDPVPGDPDGYEPV